MNIGLIALVVLQIRGHKVTRARLVFPLVATVFVAAPVPSHDPDGRKRLGTYRRISGRRYRLRHRSGALSDDCPTGRGERVRQGRRGCGCPMGRGYWYSNGLCPVGRATAGKRPSLGSAVLHHITSGAAWGAAFVLMAMAEVASRTGVLYLKTRRTGAVIERGGLLRSPVAA